MFVVEDQLTYDSQFARALRQSGNKPEQQFIAGVEPLASADPISVPHAVMASFVNLPAREGEEHVGTQFSAPPFQV
jgi:hypothetical protein